MRCPTCLAIGSESHVWRRSYSGIGARHPESINLGREAATGRTTGGFPPTGKRMNFTIIEFAAIEVTRVRADGGTNGAAAAMQMLESRMPSLRGRKMYGLYYPASDDYYACVKLDTEHPDDLGFERGTVPGGRYARARVRNWQERLSELEKLFEELVNVSSAVGNEPDLERPQIEFYRNLDELIIMVPVIMKKRLGQ